MDSSCGNDGHYPAMDSRHREQKLAKPGGAEWEIDFDRELNKPFRRSLADESTPNEVGRVVLRQDENDADAILAIFPDDSIWPIPSMTVKKYRDLQTVLEITTAAKRKSAVWWTGEHTIPGGQVGEESRWLEKGPSINICTRLRYLRCKGNSAHESEFAQG